MASNINSVELESPVLEVDPPHHIGETMNVTLTLTAKFNGCKYPISISAYKTLGDLKNQLFEATGVRPHRQKLIGFAKGKIPADTVILDTLNVDGKMFMMLGTVEDKIHVEPEVMPEVLNDLDFDFDYAPEGDAKGEVANQRKLLEYTEKTNISIINDFRPGKKLLVLDLDYTLFDCKTPASHISLLARPGMHQMLTAAYQYYDICVWSQTAWKWLEMKITELGMLTHPGYRIAFVLDRTSMFSITSSTRKIEGKPVKHEVKALDLIWRKFPHLGPQNTVHVDDVSRNFAMNPQSGLKISAFKNGPVTRSTDRVLFPLTKYLLQLALVDDFQTLNHETWKSFTGDMAHIPEESLVEGAEGSET
ncbi:hypothetical protein HKX48_003638, partial [Thoreauomyces humboldtii]